MNQRSKGKWKGPALIALVLVLAPVLLLMCSEAGMMWLNAVSSRHANEKAFQREVCSDSEQRLARFTSLAGSGDWVFRNSIEDRPSETRVEVGASDRILDEILGSNGSEDAISNLRALYWYEYCRDNNPIIDLYDQRFDSLVAVYRGTTHRRVRNQKWYREWNDYVYDCRDLEFAETVIEELQALGFWEKVELKEDGWRGNKVLRIYESPKFRPSETGGKKLTPEERGNREATRHLYYSAATLQSICTGNHYRFLVVQPGGAQQSWMESSPFIIKRDLPKIRGMPQW